MPELIHDHAQKLKGPVGHRRKLPKLQSSTCMRDALGNVHVLMV